MIGLRIGKSVMTDKNDVPDSGKDSSFLRSYERRQKLKNKLTLPCWWGASTPHTSPLSATSGFLWQSTSLRLKFGQFLIYLQHFFPEMDFSSFLQGVGRRLRDTCGNEAGQSCDPIDSLFVLGWVKFST